MSVVLTVHGQPAPKGSRTIGRRRDGSTFTRPASSAEHGWTEAVAMEAMAVRSGVGEIDPPYSVEIVFRMPRPQRPAHGWPTRGDVDKLTRALLDGLTRGGLISDDRHVTELRAFKRWASESGEAGATVRIAEAQP